MGTTVHRWNEEHLRLAVEAACVALWSWNVDNDRLAMDELAFELWGLPWADEVNFEELSAHIHPADRDRVRAAFAATRSATGSYEIDFRIMVGDEIRWISARGQGADAGIVDSLMFGIFLDLDRPLPRRWKVDAQGWAKLCLSDQGVVLPRKFFVDFPKIPIPDMA